MLARKIPQKESEGGDMDDFLAVDTEDRAAARAPNPNRSSTASEPSAPPTKAMYATFNVANPNLLSDNARKQTASTSQLSSHVHSHQFLEMPIPTNSTTSPNNHNHHHVGTGGPMLAPPNSGVAVTSPVGSTNNYYAVPTAASLGGGGNPIATNTATGLLLADPLGLQTTDLFVETLVRFNRWNATSIDLGSLIIILKGLDTLLDIGKAHILLSQQQIVSPFAEAYVRSSSLPINNSHRQPSAAYNTENPFSPHSIAFGASTNGEATLDGTVADSLVPEIQRVGFVLNRCKDFVQLCGEPAEELLGLLRNSPEKSLMRCSSLLQTVVATLLARQVLDEIPLDGDGDGPDSEPADSPLPEIITTPSQNFQPPNNNAGGRSHSINNQLLFPTEGELNRRESLNSSNNNNRNSSLTPRSGAASHRGSAISVSGTKDAKLLLPFHTVFRIRPAQFPIIFHVVTFCVVVLTVLFAIGAAYEGLWASGVPLIICAICQIFGLVGHFKFSPMWFGLSMTASWLLMDLAYTLTFLNSTDSLVFPWSVVTVTGMGYYACVLGDQPSMRLTATFSACTRRRWPNRRPILNNNPNTNLNATLSSSVFNRTATELFEYLREDSSSDEEESCGDSPHDIFQRKGLGFAIHPWFLTRVIPALAFIAVIVFYIIRIVLDTFGYPASLYTGELISSLIVGFIVLRYFDNAKDLAVLRVEDGFRAIIGIRLVTMVTEAKNEAIMAANAAASSTRTTNGGPSLSPTHNHNNHGGATSGGILSVHQTSLSMRTTTTDSARNKGAGAGSATGRHVRAANGPTPQLLIPPNHANADDTNTASYNNPQQLILAGRYISTCGEMLLNIQLKNQQPLQIWRTPLDDAHFTTILIVVDSKGDIALWNWCVEDLTHFSSGDMLGKNILSVLPSPETHADMFHRISSTMGDRNTGPIVCCLTSRKVGKPAIEVKLQPYPAKTLQGETVGVVLAGAPIPSTGYSDVSNELVEIHSTMPESASKERLYGALLHLQAELPRETSEVSLPQLFGRICSAQFQQKAVLLDVEPSLPPTISVDADGLSIVVTEMLQHYLRFGITRVALQGDQVAQSVVICVSCVAPNPTKKNSIVALGGSSNRAQSISMPDTTILLKDVPVWSPSAVSAQTIRRLNFVVRTNDSNRYHCTLVLVGLLQERLAGVPRLTNAHIEDTVRCNVAIFDTEALSSTLIRNAVWERKHMLFFIEDASKLSLALDGVDILFARFPRALAERAASQLRNERPMVEIVILLSADATDPSIVNAIRSAVPSVTFLEDPILSSEVHEALRDKVHAIQDRRAREATVSDVRKLLSQAKSCPWVRGKLLGRGANATVYEATNTITSGKMAVRSVRINRSDPELLKATMEGVIEEIKLMSRLEHKNIINYLYMERDTDCINIFMEYAPGGSIRSFLDKKGRASLEQVAMWLRDVLEGLAYLHGEEIVHFDVKSANILIGADGTCKIADFGTAKQLLGSTEQSNGLSLSEATKTSSSGAGTNSSGGTAAETNAVGTLQFMAPEVLNGQQALCDWRADIWSLGCTVMEMLTGKLPFSTITDGPLGIVGYISGLHAQDVPNIPQQITDPLAIGFITACLAVDPARRPNARSLQNHPFVVQTARVTTTVRVTRHTGVAGPGGKPNTATSSVSQSGGTGAGALLNSLMESEDEDSMRRDSCFSAWSGK